MRLPLWLVLGLTLAAYSGAPNAGFVWDDHGIVERNAVLDSPTIENVFLKDLWCCTDGPTTTGYHRPLLTATFLLDRSLFGKDPAGAHVQSLFWHLLAVGLVSALLRRRVGVTRANVAALIFALHPIQSEAVLWVSARNDLLAAAGVLGALLAADARRPVLTALVAGLACLSKESAYLLPGLLVCWRLAWGERPRMSDAWLLVGLLGALLLRSQATLDGFSLATPEVSFNPLSGLFAIITELGWVVWPWPLTTTASLYMGTPTVATFAAAVATLAGTVALLAARPRTAALFAFAALAFAPSLLGIRGYSTIGERYLYLSIFGLATAVVKSLPTWRLWPVVIGVATAAALGCLHVRAPDWATEEALFSAAVRRAPDGYSWNLLGVEWARQKRYAEATAAFDQSLSYEPRHTRACHHIAEVADYVLTDNEYLETTAKWAEQGCKGKAGFDGARGLSLAARGLWTDAATVADEAVHNDPRRKDEVVRAAIDLRDGDLSSVGARSLVWPDMPSDLVNQVMSLTQCIRGRRTHE